MKTPQEILNESEITGTQDVIEAMKEYAKQWIDRAADGVIMRHKILELKKEIDAQ